MKDKRLITSRVSKGFLVVLLMFIIIFFITLFFANQIVTIFQDKGTSSRFLIFILIMIPLSLLIFFIFNLSGIIRRVREDKAGSRFQFRIISTIMILLFATSTAQAFISYRIIRSSLDYWFDESIEKTLSDAENLSLIYYEEHLEALSVLSNSQTLRNKIYSKLLSNPESIWDLIQETNPTISGLQIERGEATFFFGNKKSQSSLTDWKLYADGYMPVREIEEETVIGYIFKLEIEGIETLVSLSTILYSDFDEAAASFTRDLNKSINYLENHTFFKQWMFLLNVIFALPLILISVNMALFISTSITGPIVQLEKATKRIAQGDYSYRIIPNSKDDFSFFTSSFNEMVKELRISRTQLVQNEKVNAWQEIAQRLAHEIRNPLTPIKLSAQRISRKIEDGNLIQSEKIINKGVNTIIHEVESLDKLLREFRSFARKSPIILEQMEIHSWFKTIIQIQQDIYPQINFSLHSSLKRILIHGDPRLLEQVINNLIANASDSMMQSGNISIELTLVKKGYSDYCRISIEDSGVGIPENDAPNVFEPYFTTREFGTGLGLAIVDRIIHDHNGRIWFESEVDSGTIFFIDIPIGEMDEKDINY